VGYHVNATDISVRIKSQDAADALDALRKFNAECPPAMKRGGTVGEDGREEKWFSWMRADFAEYESLGQLLGEMGFGHSVTDGWIVLTGWHGDKQGQEDLLMEAIARWVEDGSFVEWVGEDCYRYRWDFTDSKLLVREEQRSWGDETVTPTDRRLASIGEIERFQKMIKRLGSYPPAPVGEGS